MDSTGQFLPRHRSQAEKRRMVARGWQNSFLSSIKPTTLGFKEPGTKTQKGIQHDITIEKIKDHLKQNYRLVSLRRPRCGTVHAHSR